MGPPHLNTVHNAFTNKAPNLITKQTAPSNVINQVT